MDTTIVINIKNPSRVAHFKYLKNDSNHYSLIMKNPTWERDYFDNIVEVDTEQINKVLESIERLKNDYTIVGIVNFVEHAVPLAAIVANYLNLPYISVDSALQSRNKFLMRQRFDLFGLRSPAYELAESLESAKIKCEQIGYPVIIKPIIGGGSLSVMRINSEIELSANFKKLQVACFKEFEYDPLFNYTNNNFGNKMLIEKYIEGKEISVESIVQNDSTYVIAVHDKILPMEGPYFEERKFTTPSRHSKKILDDVYLYTKLANKSLNIDIGATHAEFRITETGEVYILEVGARIGGGPVYQSVLASTGIDMVDCIVKLSRSESISISELSPKVNNYVGFYHFFPDKEGILAKITDNIDLIHLDSNLVELVFYQNIGEIVKLPPNSIALGHLTVRGNSYSDVDKKMAYLSKKINFVVND